MSFLKIRKNQYDRAWEISPSERSVVKAQRKHEERGIGKPHMHRCPECTFLFSCSIAGCHPLVGGAPVCVDCIGSNFRKVIIGGDDGSGGGGKL